MLKLKVIYIIYLYHIYIVKLCGWWNKNMLFLDAVIFFNIIFLLYLFYNYIINYYYIENWCHHFLYLQSKGKLLYKLKILSY